MVNIEENYLLSPLTTLSIGGEAKYFTEVTTPEELVEAVKWAKDKGVEYLVIGGGSNLLVSDQGINKLVIKNSIVGLSINEGLITAKSGTPLQELVNFSLEHGLSGIHKLTGVPGSVGGAVYGSAGAYGQTISDHLVSVVALDPSTSLRMTLTKDECGFGYRDSGFKKTKFPILEVTFKLELGDKEELLRESEEVREKRLVRYPPGIKCPGSFFKNILSSTLSPEQLKDIPEDKIPYGKVNSGYLLESVGAKGEKEGDIEVSDVHANLFVNKGNGTAEDFYKLAKRLSEKVKERFGIELSPEVQLIGLPTLNN
jgi:UDP-N-acetylmuramate dehydrogenase